MKQFFEFISILSCSNTKPELCPVALFIENDVAGRCYRLVLNTGLFFTEERDNLFYSEWTDYGKPAKVEFENSNPTLNLLFEIENEVSEPTMNYEVIYGDLSDVGEHFIIKPSKCKGAMTEDEGSVKRFFQSANWKRYLNEK